MLARNEKYSVKILYTKFCIPSKILTEYFFALCSLRRIVENFVERMLKTSRPYPIVIILP